MLSNFHESKIFIENRYGSRYSGGSFILSNVDDLTDLAKLIKKDNLKLRIALDFQQLFSAEIKRFSENRFSENRFSENRLSENRLSVIFGQLYDIREYIGSIHLWGRCLGKNGRLCAHMGTLDSYFKILKCKDIKCEDIKADYVSSHDSNTELDASNDDNNIKRQFLKKLHDLLSDGSPRYFLPEVNSKSEHLQSIVRDLKNSEFNFI